jgi:hypothetical protein
MVKTRFRIGLMHLEFALTFTAISHRLRNKLLEMWASPISILHWVIGGVTNALASELLELMRANKNATDIDRNF